MKIGVVVFPGSNCDHDAFTPYRTTWVIRRNLSGTIPADSGRRCGHPSWRLLVWRLPALRRDRTILPVMQAVKKFAADGGLVMGICNGFQVLCESGLLPGALLRNAGLKFICKPVEISVETTNSPFTHAAKRGRFSRPDRSWRGELLRGDRHLDELEAEDRIAFRYVDTLQWLRPKHCRNSQRATQCAWHDAPSGTRGRSADGFHRRTCNSSARW